MKRAILCSVLVIPLFVLTFATRAQSLSGLVHKWSAEGDGKDSVGTADCLTSNLVFTTGYAGQAFSFDGTVFPDFGTDVGAFGTSDFTIGLWVQTTETGTATVFSRRLDCTYQELGNILDCRIVDGLVKFQLSRDENLSCSVQSGHTINDGNFHHVAVLRRSTDLLVYIDGVLDGQSSSMDVINIAPQTSANDSSFNPVTQTPHFVLGQGMCTASFYSSDVSQNFAGALDEIQIFNRALDDTEVYWLLHPGVSLQIVSQPFNQRTLVNRGVVFHVGVVGYEPITYQWQFNGLDIPGAISNNLALPSPMVSDSGTYSVVINNPTATTTSRQATLVVTNLSTPSDALMARWSGEGDATDSIGSHNGVMHNVSFTKGVLGSAFKFNGNGEVDCANVLFGITTNDFTMDFWINSSPTTIPEYALWSEPTVGVLGECSDCMEIWDSSEFRYGVNGSNAFVKFELGTGHPPYVSRDVLPKDWSSFTPVTCAPDTTASPIRINDGVFHHVAAVRHGRTVSMYLDGLLTQTATTREPVNYNPNYTWYYDPSTWYPPGGLSPFRIGSGECDNFAGALDEIEVHNRALSDAEIYSSYSPDPTLVILQQPHAADVIEGHSTSLSVSLAGLAPYNYQWRHNGSDIADGTGSSFVIANAQLSDAGNYTVVVGNALGTLTSLQATLTVVPSSSLLPGLVNKWTADGNANDIAGHSEIRTFNAVYTAGASGQAFNLSDTTAAYDESTGNFGTNDFTISLWIKNLEWRHDYSVFDSPPYPTLATEDANHPSAELSDSQSMDVRNVLGKGEPHVEQVYPGYALRLEKGAIVFCGSDADGHAFSLSGAEAASHYTGDLEPNIHRYTTDASPLDDHNYHHVAVVRRGTTGLELYLDGVLAGQTNLPVLTTLDNGSVFELAPALTQKHSWPGNGGGFEYPRAHFKGSLDEVELYKRALSSDEIATIHQRHSNNPQVSGTLQKIEAKPGDTITLQADSASGPGPLTYQWTYNGVAIDGATDSTLTVAVDASKAGDYALVVTNPSGSVTCPMASLTIALAPGSYNGLFFVDDDPTDDTSGYVTLTVNNSQTYTGKILQHGKSYPFTGRFAIGRSVVSSVKRAGKTPLTLNLTLSSDKNSDTVIGAVGDGQRVVPLHARRVVYGANSQTPQAGKYTMALTGIKSATAPNGHGFGNLTIKPNGGITFVAKLSDDQQASQGTAVVAGSGVWPVYVPLYGGKGSLMGWLTFTNSTVSSCDGDLRWVKAPSAGGKNYTTGFATKVPVIASAFTPPATGLGIDVSNYQLVMDGAKIYSAMSDQVTGASGNVIQFNQTNTVAGTLKATPGIGQFTGNFVHPVTKKKTTIKGIVLQDQGEAAGYFISGNLSGRVVLKHN